LIDAAGAIPETEEGTTLNEIPAPAKAAIEKSAAGGKVAKVEIVTKGGVVNYEAVIIKSTEIKVKADGTIIK
jgi:hypothetical protein